MDEAKENTEPQDSKPKLKRKGRGWRRFSRVSLTLLLFLSIIQSILYFYTDEILGNTLQEFIYLKTNRQYRLLYSKISYNLFLNKLELENTKIIYTPKNKEKNVTVKELFQGADILVEKLNLWKAFTQQRIIIKKVYLSKPSVNFSLNQLRKQFTQQEGGTKELLSNDIKELIVHSLTINDAKIKDIDSGFFKKLQTINIQLTNLGIWSEKISQESKKGVKLEKGEISFGKNTVWESDGGKAALDSMLFLWPNKLIKIQGLNINTQEYQLAIPSLSTKVQLDKIVDNRFLLIDSLQLTNPSVKLSSSITTKKPRKRNEISSIDSLQIGHFTIKNGDAKYSGASKAIAKANGVEIEASKIKTKLKKGKIDWKQILYNRVKIKTQNGFYTFSSKDSLSFSEITYDTKSKNLEIATPFLQASTKRKEEITLQLRRIKVDSIDVEKAVKEKIITGKEIYLESPKLEYYPKNANFSLVKIDGNIYPIVKDKIEKIIFDKISIFSADITIDNKRTKNNIQINKLNLIGHGLNISDLSAREKARKIWNSTAWRGSFIIDIENKKDRYKLKTKANFSTSDSLFTSSDLNFIQWNTNEEVMQGSDFLRNKSSISKIALSGFDVRKFVKNQKLKSRSLEITNPSIEVRSNSSETEDIEQNKKTAPSLIQLFDLQDIKIYRGKYTFFNDKQLKSAATEIDVNVNQWKADSIPKNKEEWLDRHPQILSISFKEGFRHLEGTEHDLWIGEGYFDTREKKLRAKEVEILPVKRGVSDWQKNEFNAFINFAEVDSLNLWKSLKTGHWLLERIFVDKPMLKGYLSDKRINHQTEKDTTLKSFSSLKANEIVINNGEIEVFDERGKNYISSNIFGKIQSFIYQKGDSVLNLLTKGKYSLNFEKGAYYSPKSNYHFFYDKAKYGSTEKEIEIKNLKVLPTFRSNESKLQKEKQKIKKIEIPEINITSFDLDKILRDRELSLHKINIERPSIELLGGTENRVSNKDSTKWEEKILDKLNHIKIGEIKVENGQFKEQQKTIVAPSLEKYVYSGEDELEDLIPKSKILENQINDFSTTIYGWQIDKDSANTEQKQIHLDSINFYSEDSKIYLDDGYSILKWRGLDISSSQKKMTLNSLYLAPSMPKNEYFFRKEFQTDCITLQSGEIKVLDLNVLSLLNKKEVVANTVDVNDLQILITRDKTYPYAENPQPPPLPQVFLMNLENYVKLDTINVTGAIEYNEQYQTSIADTTNQFSLARVSLEDLRVEITGITNDSLILEAGDVIKLRAEADFMGSNSLLEIDFKINPLSPNGAYEYKGRLEKMDLEVLNPLLETAVYVKVKSGRAKGMKFIVRANNDYSTGRMKFKYQNLEVEVLKNPNKNRGDLKAIIMSFIANNFVIISDNPKIVFLRKGKIFYRRDPSKYIFNYWVKSLLTGITSSIGIKTNYKPTKVEKKVGKKMKLKWNK